MSAGERVVVTGATGHLGVYVVDQLARAGREVIAVSRSGRLPGPPFGASPLPSGAAVRPVAADLTDDGAIPLLARELTGAAALIHLAAWHPPATAASTAADRRALLDTNVLGTQRALDAVRSAGGVPVVVYASTFEVYGVPFRPGPVNEDFPLLPVNDYGVTKLAGEDHLFSFGAEEGIRAVALRMPAVYGPGERVARALPNFLRAVARGERPVVHGDGRDRRDQLHARDAARAFECALRAGPSGAYNLSDGAPHSILELAETAMRLAGLPGSPERRPAAKRPLDFHMHIDKAGRELGFRPSIALEAGMSEELAWIRAGETSSA